MPEVSYVSLYREDSLEYYTHAVTDVYQFSIDLWRFLFQGPDFNKSKYMKYIDSLHADRVTT